MTTAVVQARMGSTRLPNKVLLPIEGKPMLHHVVERLRRAKLVDQVVIATSTAPADDPIAEFAQQQGIACFRGSEEDVLDRFHGAIERFGGETVVRITADCPLTAPSVVDRAIEHFRSSGCDYALNPQPEGMDVEVFTRASLEESWRTTSDRTDREHVTPYIRLSGKFKTTVVEPAEDLRLVTNGWSVDSANDLQFIRSVYAQLYPSSPGFDLPDILRLLEERPELMAINAAQARYEGYYKSIAQSAAQVPPIERKLDETNRLKALAEKLIPSCSQTFSKGPTQYVQGVAPVFVSHGKGSHIWDVDGNEYIDYPMALGAIILGHDFEPVTKAVKAALDQGTSFSLPHGMEVELSQLLTEVIPCAEMVRFGKNGSDATAAAVRIARAVTGRDMIACCGYHGWQDWYIGTTTRNLGVPNATAKLTVTFNYNDPASLRRLFERYPGQIAGVILEPTGVIEPRDNFLQQVRETTHQHGALLLFDEIVTGFRMAPGGAQEYFNVIPDLAAFGKAMANGFPISAVVGRREYMMVFDDIFFSTTFGGESVGLAAALATVKLLREGSMLAHIWEVGRKLKEGFNVLAREHKLERNMECIGFDPRTVILFKDNDGNESLLLKSLFQQECLKRGVLFSGGQNLCYSHSEADIDRTLRVYDTAMRITAAALSAGQVAERIQGTPVQPVFRRP